MFDTENQTIRKVSKTQPIISLFGEIVFLQLTFQDDSQASVFPLPFFYLKVILVMPVDDFRLFFGPSYSFLKR